MSIYKITFHNVGPNLAGYAEAEIIGCTEGLQVTQHFLDSSDMIIEIPKMGPTSFEKHLNKLLKPSGENALPLQNAFNDVLIVREAENSLNTKAEIAHHKIPMTLIRIIAR